MPFPRHSSREIRRCSEDQESARGDEETDASTSREDDDDDEDDDSSPPISGGFACLRAVCLLCYVGLCWIWFGWMIVASVIPVRHHQHIDIDSVISYRLDLVIPRNEEPRKKSVVM